MSLRTKCFLYYFAFLCLLHLFLKGLGELIHFVVALDNMDLIEMLTEEYDANPTVDDIVIFLYKFTNVFFIPSDCMFYVYVAWVSTNTLSCCTWSCRYSELLIWFTPNESVFSNKNSKYNFSLFYSMIGVFIPLPRVAYARDTVVDVLVS